MNNGKYHTIEYKQKQKAKMDNLFGPVEEHRKECHRCGNEFIFSGRLKTKQYEIAKFCSRSCANSRQSWWDKSDNEFKSRSYRAIAKKHHELKCVVCGFDKIVAIHHIDENKQNNDPTNLIPLCPNHHEMCHSKWKCEVEPYIKKWQSQFNCS
jgi:hypothetical protein